MTVDKKLFRQNLQKVNFPLAVTLGLVPGIRDEVKFGHCPDTVNQVTDLWELGATQPVYLFPIDGGEAVTIEGAVGDTQPMTVVGINADPDENGLVGTERSVVVVLDEDTPVAVPGNWLAVNRTFSEAAEGDDFTGPVLIKGVANGNKIFVVAMSDDQQSSQAMYQVPADKVAVVINYSTAVNRTGGVALAVVLRLAMAKPQKVTRTQIRYGIQKEGTSNISSDLVVGILMGPAYRMRIQADPSSTATDISGEFSMWLIDKDLIGSDLLAELEA